MRVVEFHNAIVAEAVVEWRRLRPGQKKFVMVMSLPVSMMFVAVFALSFIAGWSGSQVAVDHLLGIHSDGFLRLAYWNTINALDYWSVALTPMITTPLALGYIEYKSRSSGL